MRDILVIGHNPGLAETANALSKSGAAADLARLRTQFPAPSLAVIVFEAPDWRSACRERGRLDRFITPAVLEKSARRRLNAACRCAKFEYGLVRRRAARSDRDAMLLELVSLFALSAGAAVPAEVDAALATQPRARRSGKAFRASLAAASFHPAERDRLELAPGGRAAARFAAAISGETGRERTRPATPRCIKLNNYWCVKRAGWAGEIAADADGHVAFASALEGAMVAVMLLRRYYLDL